jgi:hypothetical protein
VSLTLSDIDVPERTCLLTIGAMLVPLHQAPSVRTHWERLHEGFKAKFVRIRV